ncbi:hypothetical protein CAOG_00562 [Capsaspora owczarzaki ATCC 30864]|uniref:Uncharacterized protein n=1 Tax=Capsaspora owczarzaki (strain ATCC 30864) TaxID=595528 RepID=A0A0D2WHC3_CAPO3|nr:hypothetical protein CAOG_00562 [Capsaspora owczarzaki ATCC 30864]KJE89000.1 hypothetical protein CAOG_000562 [Capsaspora owczarzaki ATCC 30864]|eukprot:XP_004365433.1 hypothetical protein CAOG_00562 [Capsaspora owczarzaki ATCC 30864]
MGKKNKEKTPGDDRKVTSAVVEGLKKLYKSKVLPLEQLYKFADFHSPYMLDSDFDARPMVLMLGQYSTGKTTFIRYLVERDFPGMHIGPEPTTDRFCAIQYGNEERVTPGNALAVQADKPFRGLTKFGTAFLSKFQGAETPAPILEELTIIDTPGVLSGEKQRLGRSYDFVQVTEWFAEKCDLILLLFDAHKLDISDEFKRVITSLKGHDDKIRLVLNKADMITGQQLMRVYGALMWSLGKVIQTPEVMRVYIGSFWDQPLHNDENKRLFDAEQRDLLSDLRALPRNSAVRKINELVKRARLAKVHALIISHLKNEMPAMFGKSAKQAELIANLEEECVKIQRQHGIPPGDFPDLNRMKELLSVHDFGKFPKLDKRIIESMDEVLANDIPALMRKFPQDTATKAEQLLGELGEANPFALANANPFATVKFLVDQIDENSRAKFYGIFESLKPVDGKIDGNQAKSVLVESKLPRDVLGKIWVLADVDKDGKLDCEEFALAMHFVHVRLADEPLPAVLPRSLYPPKLLAQMASEAH